MTNLNNQSNNTNINNNTNLNNQANINNNNNLDLFDDTIVRIKVHKIDFNWKEPYKMNPSTESIGSGFFVDDKGHIITNYHVISNAIKVYIQLPKYGADTKECEIVSVYPKLDVALLKLKEPLENQKYLELGDSELVKKGDEVIAVGYPLGQDKIKVTGGVISGYQDGDIQTDSAINPGNSGGPLILDNKVIGINYSGNSEAQNVGYAIPMVYVLNIVPQMVTQNFVNFPTLGATFNNTNETLMKVREVCKEGYYISNVLKGGSLDHAGVKSGDIICEFDGLAMDNFGEVFVPKVDTKFHISDYMKYKKVGDIIPLKIARSNENKADIIDIEISLMSNTFYPIRNLYPGYDKIDYQNIGGMVIMPLTNNHLILESFSNSRNLQKYNTLDGKIQEKLVIVNVMKGSKIAENEIIQPPLIIDKVNGSEVRNMEDLRIALHIINSKNDRKYISFLTENKKFFMLDLQETLKEEEFLSQKLGYPITEYTNKLLNNTNVTNPLNQEVVSNALKEDPNNILQNSNNMKKDIYSLMVNTPVVLSPTPTLS